MFIYEISVYDFISFESVTYIMKHPTHLPINPLSNLAIVLQLSVADFISVLLIFFLVLRNQWLLYVKYWELSTAQAGARVHVIYCTFQYLSWTVSIKDGLQF